MYIIEDNTVTQHSPPVRSLGSCLLGMGDCMMSENDPGVLVAPPSTTLPNTDLQNVNDIVQTLSLIHAIELMYFNIYVND